MIKDSVYQIMSELQFQAWKSKPENGGLSAKTSSSEFAQRLQTTNCIKDELGKTTEFKTCIAVKVQDLLIDRFARATKEGYAQKEKELKDPSADAISKLRKRMLDANLSSGSDTADGGYISYLFVYSVVFIIY